MFDFDISISCDGFTGEAAKNHLISAIGGFTAEFNNATIAELEAEIKQTFEDILAQFPNKTGKTIKDIHFENYGEGHLEIWTDNPVVFFLEYGTKDHGPKNAQFLVFTLDDGTVIRTKWVKGIAAHYMITNALSRLTARINAMGE